MNDLAYQACSKDRADRKTTARSLGYELVKSPYTTSAPDASKPSRRQSPAVQPLSIPSELRVFQARNRPRRSPYGPTIPIEISEPSWLKTPKANDAALG